jgi:hypothetical protein
MECPIQLFIQITFCYYNNLFHISWLLYLGHHLLKKKKKKIKKKEKLKFIIVITLRIIVTTFHLQFSQHYHITWVIFNLIWEYLNRQIHSLFVFLLL